MKREEAQRILNAKNDVADSLGKTIEQLGSQVARKHQITDAQARTAFGAACLVNCVTQNAVVFKLDESQVSELWDQMHGALVKTILGFGHAAIFVE